jgi:hypothetical protein
MACPSVWSRLSKVIATSTQIQSISSAERCRELDIALTVHPSSKWAAVAALPSALLKSCALFVRSAPSGFHLRSSSSSLSSSKTSKSMLARPIPSLISACSALITTAARSAHMHTLVSHAVVPCLHSCPIGADNNIPHHAQCVASVLLSTLLYRSSFASHVIW